MAKARLWETDEIHLSTRVRKVDRLKKIIQKKQIRSAFWANKFYGLQTRVPKRLVALEKRLLAKHQREVVKIKAKFEHRKKMLSLEKFKLNGELTKTKKRNKSLTERARKFDILKRFFTEPLQNKTSRVITNELFIRYLFTLEEMFITGELNRYDYWLMMTAYQSEYITREDLVRRFGKPTAQLLANRFNSLSNQGMIVKMNNKPLRIALTDLGRKEITSVVYKTKNRNMKNWI